MRSAAKAAALGGYRSAVSFGSRYAAVRWTPAPPPSSAVAVAAATPEVAPISLLGAEKSPAEVPLVSQWPASDAEGWELPDWNVEESLDLVNPVTRLVFGPPPTLEEAKAATCDLTAVLDNPTPKVHGKHDQGLDNHRTSIVPSMPRHAAQAFSLLQGRPEAQNVVASLAADKNVWDAVMKNEKVMEFCRNHQSSFSESVGENASVGASADKFDGPSAVAHQSSPFVEFVGDIKNKVTEMVSNISRVLQDLVGAPAEAHSGASSRAGNDASTSHANIFAGASFAALAVAVIMVVLVKRF